jgi:RNA-splicing ligase RtcB
VHKSELNTLEEAYSHIPNNRVPFCDFREKVNGLIQKLAMQPKRVFDALGTLGGGNHFIEIDIDENKCHWLLIHSGSRNLGANTAAYHEKLAAKATPNDSAIKFLHGGAAKEYAEDMATAQLYASVNRTLMAFQIGCGFLKIAKDKLIAIESIHNYIDFDNGVVRKGAISAQNGEQLVIPFSMADGAIIGTGKGNVEWNYSAPHGSGRRMSRSQAKELSLDEYRNRMKNVWSTCVVKNTLDESPMAYKKTDDIIGVIGDTLEIKNRIFPVYNFKCDKPFCD